MKRKDYETPTMQVVQLQQRHQLLTTGSITGDVKATMNDTWEEEDIDAPASTRVLKTIEEEEEEL